MTNTSKRFSASVINVKTCHQNSSRAKSGMSVINHHEPCQSLENANIFARD